MWQHRKDKRSDKPSLRAGREQTGCTEKEFEMYAVAVLLCATLILCSPLSIIKAHSLAPIGASEIGLLDNIFENFTTPTKPSRIRSQVARISGSQRLPEIQWNAFEGYFPFIKKFIAFFKLTTRVENIRDNNERKLREQLKENVYFSTTEPDWYKAVEHLKRLKEKGVYIGTSSGVQVFSHLCNGNFSSAIFIDFNPYVTEVFIPVLFSIVSMSKSRAEFFSLLSGVALTRKEQKMLESGNVPYQSMTELIHKKLQEANQKPKKKKELLDRREHIWEKVSKNIPAEIHDEAKDFWFHFCEKYLGSQIFGLEFRVGTGHNSWLDSEVNFRKIKQMIIEDKIHYVSGDWSSEEILRRVKEYLEKNPLPEQRKASVVNISNLHEWLFRAHGEGKILQLIRNIGLLPKTGDAILIKQNQLYASSRFKSFGTKIFTLNDFLSDASPQTVLLPDCFDREGNVLPKYVDQGAMPVTVRSKDVLAAIKQSN